MAKTSGGIRKSGRKSALKSFEKSIKFQKFESAALVGEKGIIFSKDGKKNYVEFSRDEITKMKDNILTHNHPTGLTNPYRIGSSFSSEDLTLAVSANVKEIRAVAGRTTFSMKRPKGGWGSNAKTVANTYKVANNIIRKKLLGYIDRYKGNKEIAIRRAETLHYHLVSKQVADVFKWNYSKSK